MDSRPDTDLSAKHANCLTWKRVPKSRIGSMQVTLTIPDDIADKAQALGLSIEAYVQDLLEQARSQEQQTAQARTHGESEAFFTRCQKDRSGFHLYRLRASPARVFTRTTAERQRTVLASRG